MKKERTIQTLAFMILDAVLVIAAGGIALLTRFEFSFAEVPGRYVNMWLKFLPLQIGVTIIIFMLRRMYRYLWRSVSARNAAEMVVSTAAAYALFHVPARFLGYQPPRSVLFIEAVLLLCLLVGVRCSARIAREIRHSSQKERAIGGERIMLIGAGEAGRVLLREITSTEKMSGKVCCIIDDDPAKKGRYLENVPILGGREVIQSAVQREKITQIILAIPSASAKEKRDILDVCKMTGCRIKVLPGI